MHRSTLKAIISLRSLSILPGPYHFLTSLEERMSIQSILLVVLMAFKAINSPFSGALLPPLPLISESDESLLFPDIVMYESVSNWMRRTL